MWPVEENSKQIKKIHKTWISSTFPPPPPPPPKFFDNPTLRMKTNYENISKELGKIKASFQSYPIFEFENVFCSNLLLLPPPPPPSPPHAPYYVRKAFKSPYWGFGTGKGARKPKTKIPISNNYFSFLKNNPHLAKSFIGMSMEDFDNLYQQTAAKIEEPRAYYNKNNPIRKHATNLSTSNRLLLILRWLYKYETCLIHSRLSNFEVSTVDRTNNLRI